MTDGLFRCLYQVLAIYVYDKRKVNNVQRNLAG